MFFFGVLTLSESSIVKRVFGKYLGVTQSEVVRQEIDVYD